MALDPTARRSNAQDSLKKFFIDNLTTTEGIYLRFDRIIKTPQVQGHELDRWISVIFGGLERMALGRFTADLYCATRRDNEGFRLAQLTDTVMGYLTDADQVDGRRRITLYRSRAVGSWTQLDGGIVVQNIQESAQFDADDLTKYIILTPTFRWGMKV